MQFSFTWQPVIQQRFCTPVIQQRCCTPVIQQRFCTPVIQQKLLYSVHLSSSNASVHLSSSKSFFIVLKSLAILGDDSLFLKGIRLCFKEGVVLQSWARVPAGPSRDRVLSFPLRFPRSRVLFQSFFFAFSRSKFCNKFQFCMLKKKNLHGTLGRRRH